MFALFRYGRMKTCTRAAIALRGLAVGTCCYQHKALQISSQQKEQRAPQTSDCPDVKRSPVFSPRFFFSPLSFSGPTHGDRQATSRKSQLAKDAKSMVREDTSDQRKSHNAQASRSFFLSFRQTGKRPKASIIQTRKIPDGTRTVPRNQRPKSSRKGRDTNEGYPSTETSAMKQIA